MMPNREIEERKFCPFNRDTATLQPFNGGELLLDRAWAGRVLFAPPQRHGNDQFGNPEKFGCIGIPPLRSDKSGKVGDGPNNINNILTQAKELNRIASGDRTQPDFSPREVSEHQFKESYIREVLDVGDKHKMSPREIKMIVLGSYAIEGSGKIPYDMQSGVPFKYGGEDSGQKLSRREYGKPASSAIGYTQIIIPTNLHLIHDDGGAVSTRLRELGKGTERAEELEAKAQFFSSLQEKLDAELRSYAGRHQPPGKPSGYFDQNSNLTAKLYSEFAKSSEQTSFGITGKQFASGLHALLLDGDIGPILQSRQINDNINQGLGPDFQNYLKGKERTDENLAAAFDRLPPEKKSRAINTLLANKAYKNLSEQDRAVLDAKLKSLSDNEQAPQPENEAQTNESNHSLMPFLRTIEQIPGLAHLTAKLKSGLGIGQTRKENLAPAVAEINNLVGPGACKQMLNNPHAPTSKFISKQAYKLNPILHNKNAEKLINTFLLQQVRDKNGSGSKEFEQIFDQLEAERAR